MTLVRRAARDPGSTANSVSGGTRGTSLWRLACIIGCVGSAGAPIAQANVATQVPIGPRAVALGGAFSALADDATALYWNPAGLVHVGHQEFTATHANLFQTGLRDNFAAFVLPMSPGLAAGADWYHSGFEDGQLGFREDRVDAGFAVELRPRLAVGVNAKLLTRSIELDATSLAAGRGFGFDAGVLFTPGERWRLGLVAQDAFGTRVRDTDGRSSVAYPAILRLGAAWSAKRIGLVSAQVDDRWHMGLESVPLQALAVRLGAQGDLRDSEGPTWSAGLGLRAGILRVDWAREFPPSLPGTDHFSASFEFNFNPPLVRVERPKLDDLYASLHRTYAREPFGTLRVRNLQDRSLEATVSVLIPEWMERATEQSVVLRPGAVTEVPLSAVLGERAMSQRGDRTVHVQVTTSYPSRRLVRRERVTGSLVAYAPGAIDWSRGMAQAAAFVTPRDPVVEALARDAARTVSEPAFERFASRNLALMAAAVDALATVGVAYVPDPQNPFASVAEAPHAVDTIYYPSQTLARRTGDCDDTTVLLASMLASVGVPTRFVDAPGHILLVAGTGLDERHAPALGVDSTSYVVLDHEVWIPLETTVTAKGFLESWRAGAAHLAGGKGAERFVDVTAAQARFEPAMPPGERTPVNLDPAPLRERLARDLTGLAAWRDEYFQARAGTGAEVARVSAEALVDIARVHRDAGDFAGAQEQLERALGQAPQSAMIHHGLGVVLAGQDSLERAESHFHTALALGARGAATWLDLGLVRWLRGDSTSALPLLERGIRLAGGREAAAGLLSLSSHAPGADESGTGSAHRVSSLLLRAEQLAGGGGAGPALSGSVPRLPVLPFGVRSRDPAIRGANWSSHFAWW